MQYGDEFKTYTYEHFNLGALGELPDGRRFRFCLNGATASIAGQPYQSALATADHRNLSVIAASVGQGHGGVTLGATAVTADQYKNGFLAVRATAAAGGGRLYALGAHPAYDASVAAAFYFRDGVTVQEAWTAGTTLVDLIASPYSSIIALAPSSGFGYSYVVGYAVADVPAANYGWFQTLGLACVDQIFTDGQILSPAAGQNSVVFLTLE